jgi:hypothetical protein
MRRDRVVCIAVGLVVAALAACGGGENTAGANELTIELNEQRGSGQHGTATLKATEGGRTKVVLELSSPPAEAQPAHLHPGTCEQLDPAPAYVLSNVQDGRSDTTLPVSLDELRDAELVINVHRSADEISTYVACGALTT